MFASRRIAAVAPAAMLLAACANTPPGSSCQAGEERSIMDIVYFGTNMPGGEVSVEDWRLFRDSEISPRFPGGLTTFRADGQWRNDRGQIESEGTYVLQLVHPGSAETDAAIRDIATLYKTRFQQEAVLRVRTASCISFTRASG